MKSWVHIPETQKPKRGLNVTIIVSCARYVIPVSPFNLKQTTKSPHFIRPCVVDNPIIPALRRKAEEYCGQVQRLLEFR